jgi:hypothetical protein
LAPSLTVFGFSPASGTTILSSETELVVRGKVSPSDKCSGFTAAMNPPSPPAVPAIVSYLPNGDDAGYHFRLTFTGAQLDSVSGEEVSVTVTAIAITGSGYGSGVGNVSYTIEDRTAEVDAESVLRTAASAAAPVVAKKKAVPKKKAAPKKKAVPKKPAAKARKRK